MRPCGVRRSITPGRTHDSSEIDQVWRRRSDNEVVDGLRTERLMQLIRPGPIQELMGRRARFVESSAATRRGHPTGPLAADLSPVRPAASTKRLCAKAAIEAHDIIPLNRASDRNRRLQRLLYRCGTPETGKHPSYRYQRGRFAIMIISSPHLGRSNACQSAIVAFSFSCRGRRDPFVERGSAFRAIR
jgi:hypothetical protein